MPHVLSLAASLSSLVCTCMLCYYLGCAKCVPVSMAGLCGQGESELQLSGGHSLWTCAARDL